MGVEQRVLAVFSKYKAYITGLIKGKLTSFLDRQTFLSEDQKVAALDDTKDENQRINNLMKIIEDQIPSRCDVFDDVLQCLCQIGCSEHSLQDIMKEVNQAKSEVQERSHHDSFESIESTSTDPHNLSSSGASSLEWKTPPSSPPPHRSRSSSAGDIRKLNTSPSHKAAPQSSRPLSASARPNYGSAYKSPTKQQPTSRPRSGNKKTTSSNLSPKHVSTPIQATDNPSHLDTFVESPFPKKKADAEGSNSPLEMGIPLIDHHNMREPVSDGSVHVLPQHSVDENDVVATEESTHLDEIQALADQEIGTVVQSNVSRFLRKSKVIADFYKSEVDSMQKELEDKEIVTKAQAREIAVKRTAEMEAQVKSQEARDERQECQDMLEEILAQKNELLQKQQEQINEMSKEVRLLKKSKEKADQEVEDIKYHLAEKEKKLFELDQESNATTKKIKKTMQKCGIHLHEPAFEDKRVKQMWEKWQSWSKLCQNIEQAIKDEDENGYQVAQELVLQTVYACKTRRKRPATSFAIASIVNSGQSSNTPTPTIPKSNNAQDRKFNLVVYGVDECAKGTPRYVRSFQDISAVIEILVSVNEELSEHSIRDCLRLGTYSEDRKRPILVKLTRSCDVTSILSKRSKLANKPGLSIKPDMTKEEGKIESILLLERRKLIQSGLSSQQIKLRGSSLYVNKRKHGSVVSSKYVATAPEASQESGPNNSNESS